MNTIDCDVILFYPSNTVGGAELLFKNTAEILEENNVNVGIIDNRGGWLLENTRIKNKLEVKNKQKFSLKKNQTLIVTANFTRYLDRYFEGDFKLVSWIVQPYNVVPILPLDRKIQYTRFFKFILKHSILCGEYRTLKKLVNYLVDNNSIFSMDGQCNTVLYDYLEVKTKGYLPVFLKNSKFAKERKATKKKIINLLWIGRLDGCFKNPILVRIIKDLSLLTHTFNFELTIIGDGPGYNEIERVSSQYDGLKVNMVGSLSNNELNNYIDNACIGFAMGTSAIEMAARGLPTILLDFSYSNIRDGYKYRWFYESSDFELGRSIDAGTVVDMGNSMAMSDVIKSFLLQAEEISYFCFKHSKDNHSEKVILDRLLDAIENTNVTFNKLVSMRLLRKPVWQK